MVVSGLPLPPIVVSSSDIALSTNTRSRSLTSTADRFAWPNFVSAGRCYPATIQLIRVNYCISHFKQLTAIDSASAGSNTPTPIHYVMARICTYLASGQRVAVKHGRIMFERQYKTNKLMFSIQELYKFQEEHLCG